MSSMISAWARSYGLPDPGDPAGRVRAVDPAVITAAGTRFEAATQALRAVRPGTDIVTAAIRRAWSNPEVHRALIVVSRTGRELIDICQGMSAAAQQFADAITAAQRSVDEAYRAAESVIATQALDQVAWLTDALTMTRIDRERCALVMGLYAAMTAVDNTMTAAAVAFRAAVGTDPRDHLPPGMTPPAPAVAAAIDQRNRDALLADRHAADPAHSAIARAVADALAHAAEQGLDAQLLHYCPDDPRGQGGVAIAIGDVARADTVSVVVPGVGNSPSDITGSVDLAAGLAAATARAGPAGSTGATVLWWGYDIPLSWPDDPVPSRPADQLARAFTDSASALDATRAVLSAPRLSAFTQQLREMMSTSAGLTLIGHSYGSLVVSQAARTLDSDAGVDDIVLLAAPGAGFQISSSDDYRAVDADHVYTLAFPGDPIPHSITDRLAAAISPFGALSRLVGFGTDTGPFGVNPNDPQFAAQQIIAPSTTPLRASTVLAQHDLANYLSGPALDAVAAVAAGRYASVPTRPRN